MMVRKYGLALPFVLLYLIAPFAAESQPSFDIQELEPLPALFPLTTVHDLSNAGEAVGRTWKEEAIGVQNHHAVVWDEDADPTDIGDNGRWSEARAISETGFIVGRHDIAAGMRGALWAGGTRYVLPPLAGQPASEAYDVDDSGTAVGVSLISSTDVTAVRWVNRVPQVLPGANGMSWAVAVNGSGQAVGQRDVWPERHAMLWEGQSVTILPHLGGRYAWTTNISDNGTICGGSYDASFNIHSVLWAPSTHEIITVPGPGFGAYTRIRDVNNLQQAVGEVCLTVECNPGEQLALLWMNGQVYELNHLIPPGSGWTLHYAEAINEAGEIVGIGERQGYATLRGFRLTPQVATSVKDVVDTGGTLKLSPNPSRGEGELSWASAFAGEATLTVYDVAGRSIARHRFDHLPAGASHASWSLLTGAAQISPGVYMVELKRQDGSSESARVTMVR